MEDKAVSTEDLCNVDPKTNIALSLARLEAILQTLVQNKVEALKNDNHKKPRVHSNPKSIPKRFRLTSTSSHSTKNGEEEKIQELDTVKIGIENEKKAETKEVDDVKNVIRKSALKKELSVSSAGSQQYPCRMASFEASSIFSDDDRSLQYENIDSCLSACERQPSCCCNHDIEGHMIEFDDDYISLKLNGFPEYFDTDTIMSEEAIRRARRKRRKRRKRRMKKCGLVDENFKSTTVEDTTKKAKWTIVATACLLLFMCLLLVGITLRMAPIIDDMVRKENEEFMNSLSKHKNSSTGISVQLNNT